ncbi:MAG: hypothetical protein P0Y48_06210 [Candidatus Microbacterium phytovorans]|uniref:Uncharacterized protein n=1 Tax=Candidatus Microbacterium phytovorans TaxID=3121374 RepID=A0AAJ6B3Z4_9MICO|nr:hypothetical protein [Microbacterium sp.]WEK14780.1 MAG: hypothetical protein P0Y48_06210 [Microbacterium sp.]
MSARGAARAAEEICAAEVASARFVLRNADLLRNDVPTASSPHAYEGTSASA